MVPPRAYLPAGVPNYVTRNGMDALLAERESLISEKEHLNISDDRERRIAVNHLHGRLKLLDERINTARIMEPQGKTLKEVRFGTTVKIRAVATNEVLEVQIVGVDEANAANGRISFISPLAKALINKKAGDKAVLKLPREEKVFEVVEVMVGNT